MTTTAGRIRGQVAKILNDREIIISRGAEDGVEAGMTFAVLDPSPSEVADPETGELLGTIRHRKVKVLVTRVEPRLAFARTFESRRVNVGGPGIDWAARGRILGRFAEPPRYETRPVTLHTAEPTWEEEAADRSVSTGDPVEQILDSDDPRHPAQPRDNNEESVQ